jgi:hypothetical protein
MWCGYTPRMRAAGSAAERLGRDPPDSRLLRRRLDLQRSSPRRPLAPTGVAAEANPLPSGVVAVSRTSVATARATFAATAGRSSMVALPARTQSRREHCGLDLLSDAPPRRAYPAPRPPCPRSPRLVLCVAVSSL